MNKLSLYISLISICLAISCSTKETTSFMYSDPFNGTIKYELSYPYNQNDNMLNIYPTTLVAEVQGNIIHTKIREMGVKIDFYIDTDKKVINQFFDIILLPEKYHVSIEEEDIQLLNKNFEQFNYSNTTTIDSIGMCEISKIIAQSKTKNERIIDIWSTNDILIENANFFSSYTSIDETLLDFEASVLGFKTKIRATDIQSHKVEVDFVDHREGFTKIPLDSMENIIANLFNN